MGSSSASYNYNINLYSAALQCCRCPGALNNVTYCKT